jgi:hypothetical protein
VKLVTPYVPRLTTGGASTSATPLCFHDTDRENLITDQVDLTRCEFLCWMILAGEWAPGGWGEVVAVVNTAGSVWGSTETFVSTFVNHLEH